MGKYPKSFWLKTNPLSVVKPQARPELWASGLIHTNVLVSNFPVRCSASSVAPQPVNSVQVPLPFRVLTSHQRTFSIFPVPLKRFCVAHQPVKFGTDTADVKSRSQAWHQHWRDSPTKQLWKWKNVSTSAKLQLKISCRPGFKAWRLSYFWGTFYIYIYISVLYLFISIYIYIYLYPSLSIYL